MNDTPRVDARCKEYENAHSVSADFARQLETELAAAKHDCGEAEHRAEIAIRSWDEERERALREGKRVVEAHEQLAAATKELAKVQECHRIMQQSSIAQSKRAEQAEQERDEARAAYRQEKDNHEFYRVIYRGKVSDYMGAEIEWQKTIATLRAELAMAKKNEEWLQLNNDMLTDDPAKHREYAVVIAKLRADNTRLREALEKLIKGSGCLVFLDGRNEHGTHILPALFGAVDWIEVEKIEQAEDSGFTENVFKEAESLGFRTGDWVWLDWRHDCGQYNGEGRCEIAPYWEYVGVNPEVSRTIARAALAS